ncbi:hypothetical protein ACHAXT_013030 [Thalassiosira profunda]
MTPPSPGPDAFGSGGLTAADFQEALARRVDASKPDPLARRQIEHLGLDWEQQGEEGEAQRPDGTLRGTLTLSSDIVSVAVHHEFHIKLTAGAGFVPVADHNATIKGEKVDHKERAMKKKLRAGMIDRLRADSLVRRLLAEDDANKEDGMPLCEALIQQNGHGNANELEERVNVYDNTLEGIRRAIFSHTEDNLDRAYLRLLEDAMFDACEREGEDELLDDLDISDAHHDDSTSKDCDDDRREGKRKKITASRR